MGIRVVPGLGLARLDFARGGAGASSMARLDERLPRGVMLLAGFISGTRVELRFRGVTGGP